MCDRSGLASEESENKELKCSFCEECRPDSTQWVGATDVDDSGYGVVIVTI
jgi:hypothetical protein